MNFEDHKIVSINRNDLKESFALLNPGQPYDRTDMVHDILMTYLTDYEKDLLDCDWNMDFINTQVDCTRHWVQFTTEKENVEISINLLIMDNGDECKAICFKEQYA